MYVCRGMKAIRFFVHIIQVLLIVLWTAFCGLFGILMRVLGFSPNRIVLFESRVLWAPIVCAVSGVKVVLEGEQHISQSRASIYVANHSSHFDIVAMSNVFPVPLFFIAKKELKRVPFLGQYMSAVGHIFIDRGNREKALLSMKLAAEKVKDGKNIISFPEGTRSKTGEISLFKRGAFLLADVGKIPVTPVAIIGAHDVLPSGSYAIKAGTIRVRVLEPIEHETWQSWSIEERATHARQCIIDSSSS